MARRIDQSLYQMHGLASHGFAEVAFDTVARLVARRTGPQVKLH